jgi:hypothetical protein
MQLNDPVLEKDLTDRLLSLNFHAFLRCIGILLEHIGYTDVQLAGRTGWVGRNRDGGCDLTALVPSIGGGGRRVIVQAKQFTPDGRIYRRQVDELRGVCLRAGASEAILVTTGAFSETLDVIHLASLPLLPVRLIDGRQLTYLMAVFRVGVWEEAPEAPHLPARRGIDEEFFRQLEDAFEGVARPAEEERIRLDFTLTISPRKRRSSSSLDNRRETAKAGRNLGRSSSSGGGARSADADTKKAAVPRRS